ncbi:MAG: esterase [Planctomycetota bacterium]|nr:MAG: esterase [Planctomycetota bacterium]
MQCMGSWLAFSVVMLGIARGISAQERTTVARSVTVGHLTRTYYLHHPKKLATDKPLPLLLMFHGGGSTPAFAERESKFSQLADREGFLVAYPEGVGKSWNDGRGVKAIVAQRENVDDIGFVAALIDDVAGDFPVDAQRVFATGISNGAMFSHYLGANLSSRIAAIAPVAGGLTKPLSSKFHPDRPVSVLIIQGTEDPLVPYRGGAITLPWGGKRGSVIATDQAVKMWVAHNGCRDTPRAEKVADMDPDDGCRVDKFIYGNGKDGTEVVLYRIEGGGHAWPGGRQYLPKRIVGSVCRDIDGAEIIWNFFKAHAKP